MKISLPLDQMTVAEKLQLMAILWDDISRNASEIPSPAWHGEVLAERQRAVAEGKTKFISWEQCREDIQREINARLDTSADRGRT